MRRIVSSIFIAFGIFCSSNASAVLIYCDDASISGTVTLVNDIYIDATDWSYGTLDPAATFTGPNPGGLQVISGYIDLSAFPGFVRSKMNNPLSGWNYVDGNGSTGIFTTGPEADYFAMSTPTPCSHPKYFPEPVVDKYKFIPDSVTEGDTFYVDWGSSGSADYCKADGVTYAASGYLPVIATLGLAGAHSMICYNDWGQSYALPEYLTVAAFQPYFVIDAVGAIVSRTTMYNNGLTIMQTTATCTEIYLVTGFPISSCNSSPSTAHAYAGINYHSSYYNEHIIRVASSYFAGMQALFNSVSQANQFKNFYDFIHGKALISYHWVLTI